MKLEDYRDVALSDLKKTFKEKMSKNMFENAELEEGFDMFFYAIWDKAVAIQQNIEKLNKQDKNNILPPYTSVSEMPEDYEYMCGIW